MLTKCIQSVLQKRGGVYNQTQRGKLPHTGGEMAKYEKVISFRFEKNIVDMIDWLIDYKSEKLKSSDGAPANLNKTDIVELAIKNLYYITLGNSRDADVVDRINTFVNDSVNHSMNAFNRRIEELLFIVKKIELGNKVLYRSPSVLPPPNDIDQAIRILVNERSGWNDALDEYMLNAWRSNKIKNHLK